MTNTFRCARCRRSKPLRGRTHYKPSGRRDKLGRKIWTFQCADCAQEDSHED